MGLARSPGSGSPKNHKGFKNGLNMFFIQKTTWELSKYTEQKSWGLEWAKGRKAKKCPSILPPKFHLDTDHLFSYSVSRRSYLSCVLSHIKVLRRNTFLFWVFPSMWRGFQQYYTPGLFLPPIHSTPREEELTDKFGGRKWAHVAQLLHSFFPLEVKS